MLSSSSRLESPAVAPLFFSPSLGGDVEEEGELAFLTEKRIQVQMLLLYLFFVGTVGQSAKATKQLE